MHYIYLSLSMYVCVYIYIYTYLHLSIYLSIYLPVSLSLYIYNIIYDPPTCSQARASARVLVRRSFLIILLTHNIWLKVWTHRTKILYGAQRNPSSTFKNGFDSNSDFRVSSLQFHIRPSSECVCDVRMQCTVYSIHEHNFERRLALPHWRTQFPLPHNTSRCWSHVQTCIF